MTTRLEHDTITVSAVLRPLIDEWSHRAGVRSALPDAPVVDDRPARPVLALKWLVRRLPRWHAAPHQQCNEPTAARQLDGAAADASPREHLITGSLQRWLGLCLIVSASVFHEQAQRRGK